MNPNTRSAPQVFLNYALLAVLLLLGGSAWGQAVQYKISFENAAHHEAQVEVVFSGLTPGAPLEVRMSRSSPGRYALHEFAKNVYGVSAKDGQNRAVTISRPDAYGWTVSGHDGTVRFQYTLFGTRADGTYSGITTQYAHLNIPATFVWARGLEARPIELEIQLPADKGWRVATQLPENGAAYLRKAPNLYYFMDSPIHCSAFEPYSWEVSDGQKTQRIEVALLHNADSATALNFISMIRKVVDEEIALWGEMPTYDYGRYTFICTYLPTITGDGMEHRNSTICASSRTLAGGELDLIGTVSHEFIHSWNVERFRPKTLEPFNFEQANMSGELWFAEGFTQYYTDLILVRAGLYPAADYLNELGSIVSCYMNHPGRQIFSAVEMSQQAPFRDGYAGLDPSNTDNMYISYYLNGQVIGLALDMELRTRSSKTTLDSYMRALWMNYGRTEKAYTIPDLRQTLAEHTGDAQFADDFFRKHILGTEAPDYPKLFRELGLILKRTNPAAAALNYIGLQSDPLGLKLTRATQRGTPLYSAGLDAGDILVSLNDKPIKNFNDVEAVLADLKPEQKVKIRFLRYGELNTSEITVAESWQLGLYFAEELGEKVTATQTARRDAWLTSRQAER